MTTQGAAEADIEDDVTDDAWERVWIENGDEYDMTYIKERVCTYT